MINIITASSKYIFILLGALFCLNGFLGHVFYAKKRKEGKIRKGTLQKVIIIIFVILGNIVLFLNRQDFIFIVLLFMELFYFFFILNIFPMIYSKCNRILLNDMGFLMSIGFLMLSRLSIDKCIRQYILIVAGTVIMFLVPVIVEKLHFLIKLDILYCVLGIGLLGFVLVMGNTEYGANLSINIGSFSVQPSEFVKLSYVIFIASMLYKKTSFRQIVLTSVLAAMHVLILIASNDLGAGLIYFVTYVVMLYDATHKSRYLAAAAACAVIASVGAYFLVSHVKVRVDVWQNPFQYIDAKGYQLVQSLYAIGSGGFFGTGLTKGLPGSIPVVTNDFIFSAISEEFGGLFGIILILVCLSLFFEIITVLSESRDKFNRLLLEGFGIMYIFQCFLNIGGVINCIPSTGVTIPFVSYGGSSVVSSMIMIAMVQGISAKNHILNAIETGRKDTEGTDVEEQTLAQEKDYQMRSPRMVVGGFALVLILIGFFSYELWNFDTNILDSTYNKRIDKMAAQVVRGTIYSENFEPLAYTVENEGGTETRVYPFGSLFSHVVGYSYGTAAGLEGSLNYKLLRSSDSFDNKLYADLTGSKYIGNSVITTLNVELQQAAAVALGDNRGAVVVMSRDGAILAMVSKPDFDPNAIGITALDSTENAPLLNRAAQGLYPPGSTFKIVTLLAFYKECLDEYGIDVFENYSYECDGVFEKDGRTISCVGHTVHGVVDTYGSMAHSCNGSFINMGLQLRMPEFVETAEGFLFNKSIHFHDELGIAAAEGSFALDEDSTEWNIMQTSFGQGETLISPLQNALIVQTVANKGVLYEPYMVKNIFSAQSEVVYAYDGTSGGEYYGNIMTEDEAEMLGEHLREVVVTGFPHVFGDAPYTSAGKSGTAQYGTEGYEHSLYVGYMPYEEPEIIVSVVLEGFNESGSISKYAVNAAREIFDAYYQIKEKIH